MGNDGTLFVFSQISIEKNNRIISDDFVLSVEFSTFFEDTVNKDFYFSNTEVSDILKETTALNNKKNGTFGNIPTKLLKEVSDICAPALNDIWNNEIITQKCFPNNFILADVTPVFKKEGASLLKNDRPVSVLPVVSKIYERVMQKQILEYIDKHLPPHLCAYRKG